MSGTSSIPGWDAASFEPMVSIVIPVFNGSDYLAAAIDSALAQTYRRFEVVVVDDGSNDGGATRRIAERYGDRIRYIHQENGGCGAALNTGIGAMRGTYFSWLSHDDVYRPDKLSRQVEILRGLADRETIIYGDYLLIDAASRPIDVICLERLGSREQLDMPLYALTHGAMHGCGMLVARALFERHGLFDTTLRTSQDYDLWFRFLRHVPVKYVPEVFVHSRVHDAQGSRTIPSMQAESIAIWTRFVEEVTPAEAEAMHGSHVRFLLHTADFLDVSLMPGVAAIARERARTMLDGILVTVVIPFRDRIDWTLEALASAREQTHRALDIILVDDGSSEDIGRIEAIAAEDPRVRCVRQEWRGAAAARNRGVSLARGSYVAFLDSDDRWMPEKIARQLALMEGNGLGWSHTSYERRGDGFSAMRVDAGFFAGDVYPGIIAMCPVATPTVMVSTDIIRQHPFAEGVHPGEDVIAWIDIARDHALGVLPEALAVVRISEATTAASAARVQRGLVNVLSAVVGHPLHGRHHRTILGLVDLIRAREIELCAKEREADPRPTGATARGFGRGRGAHALALGRRGIHVLKTYGVRAAWQRTRLWLGSRAQ